MNVFDRSTIFEGPIFTVEQMEVEIGSKGTHTFQVIRHPGGAGVLPIHDDGMVSLIRQLRPAVDAELFEVPAGRLSPGEHPVECAARELLEETGMTAANFYSLGSVYSSPGVFDETIHLFAATGICQGQAQPEMDEDIEVVRVSMVDAVSMALDGRINDAKTLAALFRWRSYQLRNDG